MDDKDNFLHGVRDLLSIHSSNDHTFFPRTRLSIQVTAGNFCFRLFLFFSLYINCILALAIFLDAQAGFSTYVSAPGIVQQISSLHSDLMALQSDLENSLPEDRNRCINEL